MRTLSKAEAVIHPVRLRIIGTLSGRSLTTKQIAVAVPEVPPATLYRHIKTLLASGIIEVAGQRTVNGILESTYAMRAGAAHLSREEFAAIPPEDHQRFYAAFASTLVSTAGRYFEDEDADPIRDGMTYFIANITLTDEQRCQLRLDLLDLCRRYKTAPAPDGARLTQIGISLTPELFASTPDVTP